METAARASDGGRRGRRIAFATVTCAQWCNGPVEAHVMNADGSGEHNLTREWGLEGVSLAFGEVPVSSPDWRKVAFVRREAASTATRTST
jgi:hypothetical protein